MADDLPEPRERQTIVGRERLEATLRAALREGALSNGWLIAGPKGAGKATLAYRLARAILDPSALTDDSTLDMSSSAKAFRLIAQGAHPDLFVAERQYDEKNDRYQTVIPVATIRQLTAFLNKTAGFGGWRVAIIDRADEMNEEASNALLKSLEEPPPRTALLLVANAPGRLLPTIRSRCRRIDLRPVVDETIVRLLIDEGGADEASARTIAAAAHGRPGYALTLAAEEGAEAIAAVDAFLQAAFATGDVGRVAGSLWGKAAASRWTIFQEVLLERLSEAARRKARGSDASGAIGAMPPDALLAAHEQIATLFLSGEAVNLDRRDMILAAGRALHAHARGRAA
jgi:DNA polymerase-3 subunit delta'